MRRGPAVPQTEQGTFFPSFSCGTERAPSMSDSKTPGYRHPSFWAVVATNIIAVLIALGYDPAGADPGSVAKAVGLLVGIASAAGYTVARNRFKRGAPGKKWYAKTEFWLTLAAVIVGTLTAADVFDVEGEAYRVLTAAATVLAALGYRYKFGDGPAPEEK